MDGLPTFLDEVNQRLRPEQVFEGHFQHDWKKQGNKWRGKCPWHTSKSGTAFYLNTQSLTWRCPQCDRGGGAIQYLHQIGGGQGSPRGKQFVDIAKSLGELAGVEFPERDLNPEQKEQIQKIENRRTMLETVVSMAQKELLTDTQSEAWQYLTRDRGFSADDVSNLGLGLFPDGNAVARKLRDHFNLDDAIECGLIYRAKDGGYGSQLSGYITVPWMDEYGRILTIYGRWQSKTPPDGKPKTTALKNPGNGNTVWLRSKRSPLYLDRALAAGHKDVVIVEGVFDAALLQAKGDARVIAWVAANPSSDQIETLKKCKIESATFCLDPDGAGDKGTQQGIRHLIKEGIDCYAAPVLPDSLDPDEFVNQHGLEVWRKHIDNRVHGFRFEAQKLLESCKPLNDAGVRKAIALAKKFEASIPVSLRTELEAFFWKDIRSATGLDKRGKERQPEATYEEAIGDLIRIFEIEDAAKQEWELSALARKTGRSQAVLISIYGKHLSQNSDFNPRDIHEFLGDSPIERKWFVAAHIPTGTTVALIADGGTGKSLLAYDIVKAIASGRPWNGFKTQKAKCLIVQTDEPEIDTRERLDIAKFKEEIEQGQVSILTKWQTSQLPRLKRWIQENLAEGGFVMIDSHTSINRGTGTEEKDTSHCLYLYDLRDLANEMGVTFFILHHTNRHGGSRGSTAFEDNVSEVWFLREGEPKDNLKPTQRILQIRKSRSGCTGTYQIELIPDDYSWVHQGEFGQDENKIAPLSARILNLLEANPGIRFELDELSVHPLMGGATRDAIRVQLERLRRKGLIESEWREGQRGKAVQKYRVYSVQPYPQNSPNVDLSTVEQVEQKVEQKVEQLSDCSTERLNTSQDVQPCSTILFNHVQPLSDIGLGYLTPKVEQKSQGFPEQNISDEKPPDPPSSPPPPINPYDIF